MLRPGKPSSVAESNTMRKMVADIQFELRVERAIIEETPECFKVVNRPEHLKS